MEWPDVAVHLGGLAHVATVRPDGHPHVAIVSPQLDGETVWVAVERSSTTAGNVAVTPLAAMVWSSGAEAYVDVEIDVVDEVATKERLWGGWAYDPAAFFGTPDSAGYVLLACSPVRASVLVADASGPTRRRWRRTD
jgi:hypothetical protein